MGRWAGAGGEWESIVRYLYVAGKWAEAADGGMSQTINPYDASPLETLAGASSADVDAAVAAAREAFDEGPWRRSTVTERAALLGKIADLLQRDREQLAHTESLDSGMSHWGCPRGRSCWPEVSGRRHPTCPRASSCGRRCSPGAAARWRWSRTRCSGRW
jgi:Aldehyde dehydrogenase family